MSLGIVITGPEGVVLASDTRVTLTRQPDVTQPPINVNYDNSRKLLTFGDIHDHVAAVTQGQATVGGRTIHGWMPEFRQRLPDQRIPVGEYAALPSPNPPKRWAVAMTQRMMGKGRRTGLA